MKNHSVYLKIIYSLLSIGMAMSTSLVARASTTPYSSCQCQETSSSNLLAQERSCANRFRLPRDTASHPRRRLGIRSSTFDGEKISVTPLIPEMRTRMLVCGGLFNRRIRVPNARVVWVPVETTTVESRPTFLVYVSQIKKTTASFGSFFLMKETKDINDRTIEDAVVLGEKNFTLPDRPGIISVTLPDNIQLEVNQTYHWAFAVQCVECQDDNSSKMGEGWVKRIPLDNNLTKELERTPENDRPSVYAKYGIWTETLSTLAQLRLNQPNNQKLKDDWNCLLESVNLQGVANQDLIGPLKISSEQVIIP